MEPLVYLGMVLVMLWTIRLARSKGRHPWMWGGAALLLTLIPNLPLLGMAPMVILLFVKSSRVSSDSKPRRPVCPGCSALHSQDQHYCINCGWELSKPYTGEPAAGQETAEAPTGIENTEPTLATAEPPLGDLVEAVSEASAGIDEDPVPEEAEPQQDPTETPSVVEVPTRRVAPTAASMTDWGNELFDQGRVQEAIDQFTKAIALDPNYKKAWEQRAEAYARLGRGEDAAEDRRRLRALNATPSAG